MHAANPPFQAQPPVSAPPVAAPDYAQLARDIKLWGQVLGFDVVAIGPSRFTPAAEAGLEAWLGAGHHGEMDYMARHGSLRAQPETLVPGTRSLISVRMNYLPPDALPYAQVLQEGETAAIARYALGRDYHKVLRQRLQKLAEQIAAVAGPFGHRVFVDSAPVLEVEAATQAGLGWRGKHTLLLTREHGSYFFLGELFTSLPLPPDPPATSEHCGRCTRCIDVCPTGAIVTPYRLDARRCISYLTIELKGAIPEPLRPLIGNRIYGCDDCQMVCPWNRFARESPAADFAVRHTLDRAPLTDLFAWSASDFTDRLAGSAIYRIGYERWLRNIAVGLGNAPGTPAVIAALQQRQDAPSPLVREHVGWALARHAQTGGGPPSTEDASAEASSAKGSSTD